MSKTWYEVANDWIIYGCENCGNDVYFAIHRRHEKDFVCCPVCGNDDTFATGEKIDGEIVGDDWYGEENAG